MVEFTCEADGYRTEQFSYQWRINGTNIDGATDKVFTILSVSEGDSGTYECVVTNHWNDMNTSSAQLIVTSKLLFLMSLHIGVSIVGLAPTITTHPMNRSVSLHYGNESVTFTCDASGTDVEYLWFVATNNGIMKIQNKTSNTLTIAPVTITMNYSQYYCTAVNEVGMARSNKGYLVVDYAIGKKSINNISKYCHKGPRIANLFGVRTYVDKAPYKLHLYTTITSFHMSPVGILQMSTLYTCLSFCALYEKPY